MTLSLGSWPVMHPGARWSGTSRAGAVALALSGLALSGPVLAEGTPTAPTPAAQAPKPMPMPMPTIQHNPAETMAAMARELDKHPDQGVLVLENITITQADMADVIRTMPPSLANLGFQAVTQRALDVLVAQKAMVLNALKAGLDKDPTVLRKTAVLHDKALSDAWLAKIGDAAVNDKALHERYDRDVAGKPGPDEVRARVIVVPTQDEARLIIGKIQGGGDFAELARTYSKDGTAAQGGDLGYVTLEGVTPEIGHIMFALAPGQITAFPTWTPAGYFIIRVEGRRQRGTPTFDEARGRLEGTLRSEADRAAIENIMAHVKMAKPAGPPKK